MQQKCAVKVLNLKKTTGAVPQKCPARSHAAHICSDHLYYPLPVKTLPLHMHFCILVLHQNSSLYCSELKIILGKGIMMYTVDIIIIL